ncbi:TetR family transcriptional regulator [Echinicola pacifica]|uniref:TetR family transcriptional regulator n=1 Tax=Echinicola pacifica TaxID=346377 RepID=A0A918UX05_9BACT|nr:TetR/AcrR family transcriptional regulator [Echinicola pacifica]GGZ39126.1 TetR family transcriptional regulator [Echinicola pacifica]
MARKKEYLEEEVIEKAMALFWKNGYETTSMQRLEKEMGINKFSIYSSFGSKNGVFVECLNCYKQKLNVLLEKLLVSDKGIEGIKEYFYDFLEFSRDENSPKGCLITNTANELGDNAEPEIKAVLLKFMNEVRAVFAEALSKEGLSPDDIESKADYYIISMFGLASSSKIFTKDQISTYIESIFNKG